MHFLYSPISKHFNPTKDYTSLRRQLSLFVHIVQIKIYQTASHLNNKMDIISICEFFFEWCNERTLMN